MKTKEQQYAAGLARMKHFCAHNGLTEPVVRRLTREDRLYHLATCAYYRPHTITIMVEKCASLGMGGRGWSWPGYTVDRTPYGVIQHELGHHVDTLRFIQPREIFSQGIWEQSREAPMTGYLGTDQSTVTFYMEWFAENFRLFVTNPNLCYELRPKFHAALIRAGIKPLPCVGWQATLEAFGAPERIVQQAAKKIAAG